jgi:hypothetical protein
MDSNETIRLVALINKKIEPGIAMNALAHLAGGIVNLIGEKGREKLKYLDFIDADGKAHRSISARSLIVLRGTGGNIHTVRELAQRNGIPMVDFTDTMTGDTYVEQVERTRQTHEVDLRYYGVMLFGRKEDLDPITRKYSLWK